MGVKFSPSLANIFMAAWEQNFIFSCLNPFAPHFRWYGRYIDDLLLVCVGTQVEAEIFVQYLNDNPCNFKIYIFLWWQHVPFLGSHFIGKCNRYTNLSLSKAISGK